MTNATVLVEALVQAGILRLGKNNMWYVGPHDRPSPPLYRNGDTALDLIVTDWRAAGKVLESANTEMMPWINLMRDVRRVGLNCESIPRAIIEAWYEARQ